MQRGELEGLLADARLVVGYLVRIGKLPDNTLPNAIAALEQADTEADAEADLVAFQHSLSQGVRAMEPMTLVSLRAGHNPFDERNVASRKRWQFGLSLATLLLIAIISYCHFMLQREDAALRAYVEARDAQWSEKITAARKIAQRQNALGEQSCHYDSYQLAVQDIKKLSDKTNMAWAAISGLANESAWPVLDGISSLFGRKEELLIPSGGEPAAGPAVGRGADAQNDGPQGFDLCDPTSRPKNVVENYPKWLQRVIEDYVDETCFARVRNVNIEAMNPTLAAEYSSVVAQRAALRTSWILPFLYGLLGACVYVMRRLLFSGERPFVENVVILLRLALGALAGIVIGWFATPASGPLLGAGHASTLPYVMAFLGGFSIDSVFALLDRLTRTIGAAGSAAKPA